MSSHSPSDEEKATESRRNEVDEVLAGASGEEDTVQASQRQIHGFSVFSCPPPRTPEPRES